LYLTPAAIGYGVQVLLALLITGYLVWLTRHATSRFLHLRLLIGFFGWLTAFLLFLFFETALLSNGRIVLYFINVALAIALLFLLQFAYYFPALPEGWRVEQRVVLWLSVLYALGETIYAFYRLVILLGLQQVLYRPNWADYVLLALFLWVPVVFFRQLILQRPGVPWWKVLWQPKMALARGLSSFVVIFLVAALLNVVTIFRSFYVLPAAVANSILSAGILISMFSFAMAYLAAQPLPTSFITRFSGIFLVALLSFLGGAAWIVTPPYERTFQPDVPENLSLRFTPTADGGYELAKIAYFFEAEFGQNLLLDDGPAAACSAGLDFVFDFYGRRYQQVFVCNDGTIGLGRPVAYRNYQFGYGAGVPVIMPLLMDWDPTISEGAVYARQEADRLIVTWDRLRGFRRHEIERTFQAVLYADGSFVFSYAPSAENQLEHFFYYANDDPGATFWAIGAVPERQLLSPAPLALHLPQGEQVLKIEPRGGVQDFNLDFRRYLNEILQPFAWLVLMACVIALLGFPLLLNSNLIQPLRNLLEGVQQIEAGEYCKPIPVYTLDELGLLTRAFNAFSCQLLDLINNLEMKVQQRTAELSAANERLRSEMQEREQAQLLVIQQQRSLAAFDERERLGRDLHDGIGQVLGYLNVQAQAALSLLAQGQKEAAMANLSDLAEQARLAQAEVRRHILGLQAAKEASAPADFFSTLKDYIHLVEQRYQVSIHLWLPSALPSAPFAPKVEEQVLYILREAIGNAAKHARAKRIDVGFEVSETTIQMTVMDDGVGFEPGQQALTNAEGQHVGLHVMMQRAAQIGANLQISSQPGVGTRIHLSVLRSVAKAEQDDQTQVTGLRVVIADDHPLFRDGLRNLLLTRGVNVVAAAADGEEAVEKANMLQPDLVILDWNMPRCNGLEATRRIKAANPNMRIVILTVAEDEETLFEAMRSGASGYLLKNLEANQFFQMLTDLINDELVVPSGMARRILGELTQKPSAELTAPRSATEAMVTHPAAQLNPRQLQILQLVSQGMTYKEVGVALGVTEKTVKYHMGQILERLNVQTRAEAMAYLWQQDKPSKHP